MLTAKDKRRLRQIAHHLDPVVLIAGNGASQGVIDETKRALADHELIKVKINNSDRALRRDVGDTLATACDADVVQVVGKVWVLYKPNPDAEPRLSNLARFGHKASTA